MKSHLLYLTMSFQCDTELRENQSSDLPANAPEHQKEASPPPVPEIVIGEGGESGDIVPGKSVVFATLEVCLCVLVRHLPSLNPAIPSSGLAVTAIKVNRAKISEDINSLIATALQIIAELPMLCSPKGMHRLTTFYFF